MPVWNMLNKLSTSHCFTDIVYCIVSDIANRLVHSRCQYFELRERKTRSRLAAFLKRDSKHRWFPVNVAKFLRTHILKNICKRLLLHVAWYSIFKRNHFMPMVGFISVFSCILRVFLQNTEKQLKSQ